MVKVKQLFEILQKHKRMDLLQLEATPTLIDGKVAFSSTEPIDENDELTCSYYCFHHLNNEFPQSKVLKAIEEKDFQTFERIYNDWEYCSNLCYLPMHLCLTNETNGEPIGYVNGVWLQDIFDLIDFAECECG